MEHPRPDDREHFERHPDVRGLAGLDRHQHPHIDEGLSEVIDLFSDSRDILELSDVPPGGILAVTVLDEQGTEQALNFIHSPKPDSDSPAWRLLTAAPNGDILEETATVHGSGIPGRSMIRLHRVTEGLGLVYVLVQRLEIRSIDELPPNSHWRYLLGEMGNPDHVSAEEQTAHLKRGLIIRKQDGTLYWSIPEGTETTTGPIVRAEIIPPDTSQPADQI